MGLFMTQLAPSNKPFGDCRCCQSNVTPEVPKREIGTLAEIADFSCIYSYEYADA
jgi:hypothetical protein